ncbi:DUF4349 domain-containing protein [Aquibacillus salsiterrae]|uniref:DUF4349 domain-containing protein n=1 Tax=Aquibacillus salsiterrae TaxID=2950439 RepID=A0A9X3WEP9_9BACI|nr:DUF4349 domain-containing protein [Aquibacillus salsiterrae]MDC3417081.1 DUF4349 domain-containing protein [Aquibacillus salsiterrae]
MRGKIRLLLIICFFLLSACSSNEQSQKAMDTASNEGELAKEEAELSNQDASQEQANTNEEQGETTGEVSNANVKTDRKIIYDASLRVEVKNYEEAVNTIQSRIENAGGYIVESQTYGGETEDSKEGMVKARIPQAQFRAFLETVEKGSSKVIENTVTGQDVTEEFVDLKARLKAKQVVETRLLSFMEKAEKTEDLLNISDDLATVQQEIEQITGRMNYLQNRSDLATVTIRLSERRVTIPKVNDQDLNTWERTKQQFMESINFLLIAASSLTVFIVGNLPIILLLLLIGLFIYRAFKKDTSKKK